MWSGNGTGPGCYHGRDLLVPALCFKCNKIWLRKVSWTLIEKTQCPFGKGLVLTFLRGNKRDFLQIHISVLKGLLTVRWRFRGKWSPLEQKGGGGVCVCSGLSFSEIEAKEQGACVSCQWNLSGKTWCYLQGMHKTRPEAPQCLITVKGSVGTCLCSLACSIYVEIGDAAARFQSFALMGPAHILGGEEGAGGLRAYEVNRKITHLNDAFHWHCRFESLSDLILSVFPSITSHRCD